MTVLPLLVLALLALSGCGGGGAEGDAAGTETITPETGVDPGSGSQNFSVALNAPSGGGEMGSANVTAAEGEQVRVTIQIDGGTDETLSAEIREGTCDDHGEQATVHELSEIEGGRSETLLDASMDELRTTPHAIVVGGNGGRDEHRACGNLVGDATGG